MENGARIGTYGFKSLVLVSANSHMYMCCQVVDQSTAAALQKGDLIVRGIFSATFLFQYIPVATSISQLPTKQQRSAYKSLQSATLSIIFGNCATIAFDVVYGIIKVDGRDTLPYLHAVLFALSNLPLRIGYSVLYMSILRLIEDRHKNVVVEVVVPPQRLNADMDIVVEQHQQVRHEPAKIPGQILLNVMSTIFTPALIILAIASSATLVQVYINMYDPRQTNVGAGFIPSRPSLDSHIGRSAAVAIAFYVVWGVAAMHLVLYASLLRSSLLKANIQDQVRASVVLLVRKTVLRPCWYHRLQTSLPALRHLFSPQVPSLAL
jgi:hypothetical protein